MILTRSDIRLLQSGIEHVVSDTEFELEINCDNEAICRWANETAEQAEALMEKLEQIYDALTNLYNKDVEADVLLTPALPSDP